MSSVSLLVGMLQSLFTLAGVFFLMVKASALNYSNLV